MACLQYRRRGSGIVCSERGRRPAQAGSTAGILMDACVTGSWVGATCDDFNLTRVRNPYSEERVLCGTAIDAYSQAAAAT